ncbi:MAG: hypothetical protein ACC653_02525 [Gammaproteobacteria bacterium]
MSDEGYIENLTATDNLLKFLHQNNAVNFLVCDLKDEKIINKLNFKNFKRKQNEMLFQIKAYQRLLRIIPDNNQPEKQQQIALLLIQQGIHSALQIAAQTRKDFLGMCSGLFNENSPVNDKLSAALYQNALEKRSVILIQYMNVLQNGEPHISASRIN